MPAKIITLSQKDQDLLRIVLTQAADAIDWDYAVPGLTQRIKDLKERIL